MNARKLVEGLVEDLPDEANGEETTDPISDILAMIEEVLRDSGLNTATYAEAGMLTSDIGLVVRNPNGAVYHITVKQGQ
jgi:hypothetical protein